MRKFNASARKVALHGVWSKVIRNRDRFICQWCGRYENPGNAHHIVPKGVCGNAGRFELENGMHLCVNCHRNRLPTDPDGYIKFRDEYLKQKNLNYFDMRARYNECKGLKFNEDFYNQKLGGLK